MLVSNFRLIKGFECDGIKLMTLTLQVLKHHMMPHQNKLIILKFLNMMAIMYLVYYFDLFSCPP